MRPQKKVIICLIDIYTKFMRVGELQSSSLTVNLADQLIKAVSILGGGKGRYRLVVTDNERRVGGIISGRRILEVLLRRRGTSIIEKKGLEFMLNESINLFMDEAHQLFFEDTNLETALKYLSENMMGYVILVDQSGRFKGIVEEVGFLGRLRGKRMGVNVTDVMSKRVYSTKSEETVYEASRIMVNGRLRRLPVVDEDRVVGMITISDILRELVRAKEVAIEVAVGNILERKVKDLICRDVVGIEAEADVGEALEKILEKDVSGLLVFANGQLQGIVSRVDLIGRVAKIKGIEWMVEMMV
ncbi:MAG: CBS domain-containing protein [Candidatus Methanomethylicaceae archaeon]